MQSNPYGSLYGGAQAHQQTPIQQQHVPWAASAADAPPQQPAALPGEPPLPGGNPTPNGRMQQVPSPFLFIRKTPTELMRRPSRPDEPFGPVGHAASPLLKKDHYTLSFVKQLC